MFKKAERKKAKLRLAMTGASGSGKTYSSLLVASGLSDWDKIAVIDTENGSADLYADLGEYSTAQIKPPFTPDKYIKAIEAAEKAGFEVIIIDSLTHAWAGAGGILDMQGQAAGNGNGYTAWRKVTPLHNQLVDKMLQSSCHIIATIRSKQEYILTEEVNSSGKKIQAPKKVGMAPIQRDGLEYEFTVVFDLNQDHTATTSKDRTRLFDNQFIKPSKEAGEQLKEWLETGKEIIPLMTFVQKKTIEYAIKKKGIKADEVSKLIKEKFDCTSQDLTEKQAEEIIAELNKRLDQAS